MRKSIALNRIGEHLVENYHKRMRHDIHEMYVSYVNKRQADTKNPVSTEELMSLSNDLNDVVEWCIKETDRYGYTVSGSQLVAMRSALEENRFMDDQGYGGLVDKMKGKEVE